MCVTPNARITGIISGRRRQVDAVIDVRHDTDNSRRIVIDAKKRNRKVDITHVESLRGLMEDTGATHGFLVCPFGHTKAAERRAQDLVSIFLVPLDRLENFDPSLWPRCLGAKCKKGRVFWDGYPEIFLTLRSMPSTAPPTFKHVPFVHYVGKCDHCGLFHVLCTTCQRLVAIADDGEHQCGCRLPWFWLASIEKDAQGQRSAELHAILGTGNVITVDRRPL